MLSQECSHKEREQRKYPPLTSFTFILNILVFYDNEYKLCLMWFRLYFGY